MRGHPTVNGIAIQAKTVDLQPAETLPPVDKTKKRSISTSPLMLPTYVVGQREETPQTEGVDVDSAIVLPARWKNLIWVMAHISEEEDQSISSWTGFNILTRGGITVLQDNIGYLYTINAPVTQISTINKVLNHSLAIMQHLELSKIVCPFDQALHTTAAEIIWKHSEN